MKIELINPLSANQNFTGIQMYNIQEELYKVNMFFFNEDEIDDCLYEGYQDEDGIEALHAARRIVELRAQMNAELVQVAADYISSHAEEFNLNELLAVEEPNV